MSKLIKPKKFSKLESSSFGRNESYTLMYEKIDIIIIYGRVDWKFS